MNTQNRMDECISINNKFNIVLTFIYQQKYKYIINARNILLLKLKMADTRQPGFSLPRKWVYEWRKKVIGP